MTAPSVPPGLARLEDLRALTAAYARYSRTWFGFASALTGAWLLAALSLAVWRSRPVGVLLLHATPLVWLALLVRARAYYQRLGEVVQQEIPNRSFQPTLRRWGLFIVYFTGVVGIVFRFDPRRGYSGELDPLAMADVAIFVAIPMVASMVTRGIGDLSLTYSLAIVVVVWGERLDPWGLVLAVLAAAQVGGGIVQHVAHRRLERRLAALKGRSP
jgi:hypothetical protein